MSSKRFDPSNPANRREVADRLTARIREILKAFDDPRKQEIDEILREGREHRGRTANPAAWSACERIAWARRVVDGSEPASAHRRAMAAEILRRAADPGGTCQETGAPRSLPASAVALVFVAWYWFALGQQSTSGYRPDATATTRARKEAKIIWNAVDDHDPADPFEGHVRTSPTKSEADYLARVAPFLGGRRR
jgi:hypothetical protein